MKKETADGIVLKYLPQIFAGNMVGVNRKDFPAQGSGTANFVEGIPSIYSVAPSAGGKYVERADINGIGWLATQLQYLLQIGKIVTFDESFCNTIGGYPKGAILRMENKAVYKGSGESKELVSYQSCVLMSLSDGNTTNFNDEANASCIVDTPYDPTDHSISYIDSSYTEGGTPKYRWLRISASVADVLLLKESDETLDSKIDTTKSELSNTIETTKSELESSIESVRQVATAAYHYKGTLGTNSELESVTGAKDGDVYNIADTGDNYAYVSEPGEVKLLYGHWDSLGKMFDMTTLKEDLKKYTDTAKETCKSYTDEAETTCKNYTDTAKSEARQYTDKKIDDNCVLKSYVLKTIKTEYVKDYEVYSVAYLNAKFKEIDISSSNVTEKLTSKIDGVEKKADTGIANAATAKSAADDAQETAYKNLTIAQEYTDEKVKTLSEGAVTTAQNRADEAYTMAEQGVSDAATAKTNADKALYQLDEEKEDSAVSKLLDRISCVEQRLATVEAWIKRHGSTSSDDIA